MINNPVSFDKNEINLIDSKKKNPLFKSESWNDDDLKDLKTKIKTYYIQIQNYECPYCKQIIRSTHGRNWDIEHIISRSQEKNFMFEPENLCVSCVDCNSRKSNKKSTSSNAKVRLPKNSKDYLIVHPHFDNYKDFILVIKAGFYYVALEKKGEKTIEICGLNRFYEFADYNDDVADDNRILLLADELSKTTDIHIKNKIRMELAFLAIQGNMTCAQN